ncbi:MAG: PIG-L deacetylase family protein [Bdellovibrio sp.]
MKKKKVIVVAPHPDDETLGCGGTLLKHKMAGDEVHWLIATQMNPKTFSSERIKERRSEIQRVAEEYSFATTHILNLYAADLNSENLNQLIKELSGVFSSVQPEVVYAPFYGDIHTDHYWVFRAVMACSKSFRYPSIKKILCYETVSETEFGVIDSGSQFFPQVFVDVSGYLDKKIQIMGIFKSEMGKFPNPRSHETIEALCRFRGSTAGVLAAESFQLIKEIL